MPISIDIREFPDRLEEALEMAAAGEDVIIVDGTTPRARIVPLARSGGRVAGLHPGAIVPTPDFDAPLPDDFWSGQQPRDEWERHLLHLATDCGVSLPHEAFSSEIGSDRQRSGVFQPPRL